MDKSEIPDLTKVNRSCNKLTLFCNNISNYCFKIKAPGSLLEALEAHVNGPDSKKTGAATNGAAATK